MSTMRDILEAVRAALRDRLELVDYANIVITPHEGYLPPECRSPAVGIKDGNEQMADILSGIRRIEAEVHLVCWVQIMDEHDASLMGNDDGPGVLAVAEEVLSVLHPDLLGLADVLDAVVIRAGASQSMSRQGVSLQRKMLTIKYSMEV